MNIGELIGFCETKSELEPENKEFFNSIIKIIEQESDIANIKQEVGALSHCNPTHWNNRCMIDLESVLEIINKYEEGDIRKSREKNVSTYCNFEMKVIGKKQNLDEFKKIIQAKYNYYEFPHTGNAENIKHFSKIYEADVCNENDNSLEIKGRCCFSIWFCMFDAEGTEFNKTKNDLENVTCIEDITKELDLTVEINSENRTLDFSEHHIVKNGRIEGDDDELNEIELEYDENEEPIDTFYGKGYCITEEK